MRRIGRAIPADGEGATHLISIEVVGCANQAAAHKIAKTVAESSLVKTAITGGDPNWGRIVSAAGCGVLFDPGLSGTDTQRLSAVPQRYAHEIDASAVSAPFFIRDNRETSNGIAIF